MEVGPGVGEETNRRFSYERSRKRSTKLTPLESVPGDDSYAARHDPQE